MSDPISGVTATTTLAATDLFALAKDTGAGPTGFGSRHITVANLVNELANNATFITELTTNTDFVTELAANTTFVTEVTENGTFITELLSDPTFVTNQSAVLRTAVETEAGTSYTLELADGNHKWKQFTAATDVTVTIPPQSSVAWLDNTYIEIEQAGDGAVIFVAGVGVTLNFNENLTNVTNGNFAVAALKRTGEDTWNLFGNLVPA